ncbi:MAG TPA: ATP-dependent helicase HrpB [Kofleriaceae bacterium]|nr:ATP-dependent helicase HrpB [Kofleriaceae bacterium]
MALARLPIDDVLADVATAVRARRTCVLVAPPGAGKTTRVPGALLGEIDGSIVVLQPRRLAARLAAARIASERGSELGGEVGYQVRFDRRTSAATRIELVTEGVLTRRLLSDPELRGVGCIAIDEFHERHLDGDLALALVARLRERRPELALVVMSATLDAEPVAAFLGNAPIVRSEGRTFPIEIEYAERSDAMLGKQISAAVRRVCQAKTDGGDILVFLPGTGEIRRAAEDLAECATTFDLAVLPLHGELTADEQDRAVRPSERRKVILATNVAETSVTIDGVTCVIDSGLARVARHSPWSGIPSLEIEPISRASAAQRAGRAGRTRPGRVIRLYTKHDHDTRRAFDAPEIARADLAGAALELHGAGIAGVTALRWFEPPPPRAAEVAEELLGRLGAVDRGAITPLGRRMLRFPAHPRVARLLCEAEGRGVAREACVIAATLGARELRNDRRGPQRSAKLSSPSDLIDDLDAFYGGRDLDRGTAYAVERAAKQLERIVDTRERAPASDSAIDAALQLAILTAYPDRVGKRRAPKSAEIVFAGGGSGALAPSSSVIEPELMVVVDVAETGRGVQIRRASAIEASWLLDLYLDRIAERDELVWDAERQRVERVVQMTYDGLAIDEHRDVEGARRAGRAAAELLAKQAIAAGIERFVDKDALAEWRARVALAAKLAPSSGLLAPTDDALASTLAAACEGAISFAELRDTDVLALLDAALGDRRALVDRLAPTHFTLPNKRRARIHYPLDQAPYLASRIQDFFGLSKAPTVGDGRVPLVLHLLAPNQRPVQVTSDLPNFWVAHYPALRRQLMRRYPRHPWPEDPQA